MIPIGLCQGSPEANHESPKAAKLSLGQVVFDQADVLGGSFEG
jgi:hypothetical protein